MFSSGDSTSHSDEFDFVTEIWKVTKDIMYNLDFDLSLIPKDDEEKITQIMNEFDVIPVITDSKWNSTYDILFKDINLKWR